MSRRVLVTGATGFLGSVVVRRALARGWSVEVLARASSDRSALAGADVVWRAAELTDAAEVDAAIAAAAAAGPLDVVHSAALISYDRRDAELQRRVNVDGTRNVLEACLRHGVRRLLHVSSVVAVALGAPDRPRDETAAFDAGHLGVGYVTTKRAAEELVLAAAERLDVVVVNPAAIFGPTTRATSNSARLLDEVRRGKRFLAAPPGGVTLVGVEDAAEGCLLALERGRRGERYLLGESYWTLRALLDLLSRATGGPGVRRTVPRGLWRLATGALAVLEHVVPMRYVTAQALTMLGVHWNLDASRARRELDWRPEPARDAVLRALEQRP